MTAKRILHVIPRLGHGGAEHQLLTNIEHLDKARFENHVCRLYHGTILLPELEAAGAQVHSAVATGPLAAPRILWNLVRVIRRLNPDLIHTSNVLGELYGGIAGRICGVPVISTITNTLDKDVRLRDNPHLNQRKLNLVGWFRRQVVRRTHTGHIAISTHVAESAQREMGLQPSALNVIYRGIPGAGRTDKSAITEISLASLDVPTGSPVILNVGRLIPQKGQRYLIQAMPKVLQRHPNAVLLIVGVGFLEKDLKRLVADLKLEDHVKFLGRRDDVPSVLGVADIFVFPSLYEGLGVSLLEACESGLAVIASDTGPLPEVVQNDETGLLVPPANPDAISEAIVRLAGDPLLRQRLGESASKRVREEFTIERAVAKHEEVYESILAGLSEANTSSSRLKLSK